jgi:hypothetical protein
MWKELGGTRGGLWVQHLAARPPPRVAGSEERLKEIRNRGTHLRRLSVSLASSTNTFILLSYTVHEIVVGSPAYRSFVFQGSSTHVVFHVILTLSPSPSHSARPHTSYELWHAVRGCRKRSREKWRTSGGTILWHVWAIERCSRGSCRARWKLSDSSCQSESSHRS